MTNLFFLFQCRDGLYIVDSNHVQDVPKPRELIRRVSTVEQCREIAEQIGLPIVSDTARKRTRKHTEEGRQRIREAKLGDKHPHKDGLKDEHKERISKTMQGTRGGENNPMYGRRHRVSTREKMHEAWIKRERRYWVCDPNGKATTIPKSQPLPEGWQRGRFFDPYKPDTDELL